MNPGVPRKYVAAAIAKTPMVSVGVRAPLSSWLSLLRDNFASALDSAL